MKNAILALAAVATFTFTACGDSSNPIQVVDVDARGSYDLTTLRFDPQGILPEVDLRARLTQPLPRLTLAANGQAQLVFVDPETGLFTVSDATYTVTNAGAVKVDFGSASSLYSKTFLSRNMTFSFTSATRTLTFTGASPDGVSRARLIQLVPEWKDEQLLDPVPGVLTVVYKVTPAIPE